MTRAKEELYLCHARLREFRGQTLYAIPSNFLDELPAEGVELIDLSASAGGTFRAMEEWRGGSKAAEPGWIDAGVIARSAKSAAADGDAGDRFAEGMLVRHETYGHGRVTEVGGYGALRKVKVRFPSAGERTFLAQKARLTIVSPA
jgi:DNA helicase-2/ATP-dependent DNA helicase PcrA